MAQVRGLRGAGRRGALPLVFQVLLRRGQGGLPQLFQEALDGRHVRGHFAGQAELGEAAVAQQGGHLLPQLQDAGDERGVVQFAAAGTGDRGAVKLFTKVAPPAVRHEGHEGRVIQGDAPGAALRRGVRCSGLAGGLRRDVQKTGRQSFHVLRVVQGQRERLGGVQNVVAELGADLGQFLLDGVEAFLFFALQTDAGQLGVAQEHLDNALLGGVAILPGRAVPQFLQRPVDGLALSQPHEELHDGWLHVLVGGPQCLAVLDAHQVTHDAPRHAQTVPEAFERLDQPLPGGLRVCLQVAQRAVKLIEYLTHGRRHVLGANAVESRKHAAFKQWIRFNRGLCLGHGGISLCQDFREAFDLPIHRAGTMPRAVMAPISRKVSW